MTDDLHAYLSHLFGGEDEVLAGLRQTMEDNGLPAIEIEPENGRLLQFLLTAVGARRVAEIGTLAGYSGIWLARSLPAEGRLITLEKNPERAEIARESFARAGLADRVTVRVGEAPAGLDALAADGPFDAVFIDADKARYPAYLDWAIENLRPGGLVLAHNAFMYGAVIDPARQSDADVRGMRAFNQRLSDDPGLLGVIIPIGDGIAAAVRLG